MNSIILDINAAFMTPAGLSLKEIPSVDILALIVIIIVFVALIAAWLLGWVVASPFNKLRKDRGAQLEPGAGPESPEEVGQLFSRVFNRISKNLNTTTSSIETLHKEIAAHKLAEDTLKRAKTDLEKAYLQLQEAFEAEKKQAAQAHASSAAKSKFIANVSHEIRTPLTGIIGICDLLLETKMSKEQVEYAKIINTSADTLLNIINSTLDLSKIEAGKMEMENIGFNLGAVVEEVACALAVKALQKKLELIYFIEPDVPFNLKGDPGRLRQILVNLIGNAIKFTSKGEIFVKATLEDEKDDQVVLRFSVRDTGIGILDVRKNQLFNMFTQADASIARNFGGTGLGLAIAKGLVKQMGGTIGVESEHGKGSIFWFVIPFLKQEPLTVQTAMPPDHFAGARVLVVDDNETSRTALSQQLQAWKAMVETAADGKAALAMMRSAAKDNNPFTAAIIDFGLPEMDGFALGQIIKADSQLGKTALLLMPPMTLPGDTYAKHKHLFAALIPKPIRQSHLHKNLLSALKGENISAPDEIPGDEFQEQAQSQPGNRLRILVAEDNLANQKVALTVLEKMGHFVNAVANGMEAVKALETIRYDLVLMDIQMPEMDGLEATAVIRDPKSPVLNHNIPILALTARVMEGDREKCLAAGMNGYIAKPISMKSITNAIANLSSSNGGAALPNETIHERDPDTVFDSKTFSARIIGDKASLRDVVNIYLSETRGLIHELEQAVKNRHQETSSQLAHNIKGGAATVSGNKLRALAIKLQKACEAANWPEAGSLLLQLNGQFEILERAMREYLKKAVDSRQAYPP